MCDFRKKMAARVLDAEFITAMSAFGLPIPGRPKSRSGFIYKSRKWKSVWATFKLSISGNKISQKD